jgi:hypothetical protein
MTIRFKPREHYKDDPRNAVSNAEIAWRFLYVALCKAHDEQSPFVPRHLYERDALERLIGMGHIVEQGSVIAINATGYDWWTQYKKENYNVGKHYQRKTEARKPRAKSTPKN